MDFRGLETNDPALGPLDQGVAKAGDIPAALQTHYERAHVFNGLLKSTTMGECSPTIVPTSPCYHPGISFYPMPNDCDASTEGFNVARAGAGLITYCTDDMDNSNDLNGDLASPLEDAASATDKDEGSTTDLSGVVPDETLTQPAPGSTDTTRPHKCKHEGCTMAFGRRSDMVRHAKKHDRPTLHCLARGCPYRNAKGFYRWDKLEGHQRTKHGLGIKDVPWGYIATNMDEIEVVPCSMDKLSAGARSNVKYNLRGGGKYKLRDDRTRLDIMSGKWLR